MANRRGKSGSSGWFFFLWLQNHCRQSLQPWNEDIFSSEENLWPTWQCIKKQKHHLADKGLYSQSYGFSSMYGCESWTIKKAEHRRIYAFELWCWRRLLRVPWTARRSHQSILKEINPEYSLEEQILKLKLQLLAHLMQRAGSLERTLMLGKIEGKRRKGQMMRRLNSVTDSIQRSLVTEQQQRAKQRTPVSLPGKSHGQRSLAGYSPWGCKRVRHFLEIKQQQQSCHSFSPAHLQSVPILAFSPRQPLICFLPPWFCHI